LESATNGVSFVVKFLVIVARSVHSVVFFLEIALPVRISFLVLVVRHVLMGRVLQRGVGPGFTGLASSGRASQTFTVLSELEEARWCPSGLNATLSTSPVCPLSVRVSRPVAASQRMPVGYANEMDIKEGIWRRSLGIVRGRRRILRLGSFGSTRMGLGVRIRREPKEGLMRFTISRWMAATAVLCLNIGLVRAYLIAEQGGEHMDLFDCVFLIAFALQLGLWRYLSTAGRRRRFWLGFEVCGLAATLAITTLSTLLVSDVDLNDWYTGAASDLSYLCLPARVDIMLTNEHWDWFLAIIYFLPELVAAAFGGLLAASLFRVSERRLSGSTV
jgi:hypothetical protein